MARFGAHSWSPVRGAPGKGEEGPGNGAFRGYQVGGVLTQTAVHSSESEGLTYQCGMVEA